MTSRGTQVRVASPVPARPPLSVDTLAAMQKLMGRYPRPRSALLPMLYLVQAEHGFVSREGMKEVGKLLGLSAAEIAAVATFYTMFKRRPCGTWLLSVCTNVSCDLAGGTKIYRRLKEALGAETEETTADGLFTVEEVECLGACDGAPVLQVNYENYEHVTEDLALSLIESLRAGNVPQPTRGERPKESNAVSRRLSSVEAKP
ncbi:MAG: NADH-quinone oxidoreductase subunit NuoE [Actinomycetota bacterium]|nr:NAD(P)H-dependent oxidoreductase subunit E [Actinomycetota bacterium]